jgi:hypothetical protein
MVLQLILLKSFQTLHITLRFGIFEWAEHQPYRIVAPAPQHSILWLNNEQRSIVLPKFFLANLNLFFKSRF